MISNIDNDPFYDRDTHHNLILYILKLVYSNQFIKFYGITLLSFKRKKFDKNFNLLFFPYKFHLMLITYHP